MCILIMHKITSSDHVKEMETFASGNRSMFSVHILHFMHLSTENLFLKSTLFCRLHK